MRPVIKICSLNLYTVMNVDTLFHIRLLKYGALVLTKLIISSHLDLK